MTKFAPVNNSLAVYVKTHMTVQELIEKLQKCDPTHRVVYYTEDDGYLEVYSVKDNISTKVWSDEGPFDNVELE